ncbi:helix-turn-helix domain-containing protein, partial [Candidatus Acetothermia bacterium]|nr:helix-turn-helix domain-containing protein [Candidatus Acetothermia bacterium]
MRPKGSAKVLEARRQRAATLLERGSGIREVAQQVMASPSSVKRWKELIEKGGKEALMAKPHPGRPSRLSPQQREELLG